MEFPSILRKCLINTQGPGYQPARSSKLFDLRTDLDRGQRLVKDLIRGWAQVLSLKSRN